MLLVDRLRNAFLLDPEVIGGVLRDRLVPPSVYPGDFQDLGLWRAFTKEAVADAAERFDGIRVVPMTVVRLDHFTLTASRETILTREAGRADDTGAWAEKSVDWVVPALVDSRFALHIDAETQTAPKLRTTSCATSRSSHGAMTAA